MVIMLVTVSQLARCDDLAFVHRIPCTITGG
jgi:hypothetical protein